MFRRPPQSIRQRVCCPCSGTSSSGRRHWLLTETFSSARVATWSPVVIGNPGNFVLELAKVSPLCRSRISSSFNQGTIGWLTENPAPHRASGCARPNGHLAVKRSAADRAGLPLGQGSARPGSRLYCTRHREWSTRWPWIGKDRFQVVRSVFRRASQDGAAILCVAKRLLEDRQVAGRHILELVDHQEAGADTAGGVRRVKRRSDEQGRSVRRTAYSSP